jgi:hypothetical protein
VTEHYNVPLPITKLMINTSSKQSLQNPAEYYKSDNLLGIGYI